MHWSVRTQHVTGIVVQYSGVQGNYVTRELWKEVACLIPRDHDLQTEELLVKRRSLLEKKIAQELDKAKTYTKAQNKRGGLPSVIVSCHPLHKQHLSSP